MSLAKIHAFSAWVNLRLEIRGKNRLQNVLVDLFQDFHWQNLVEKFTGSPLEKIGSFTGISQIQKSTRIEWIIKELISWKLLKEDLMINPKLLAARNSEETFSFLMKLVHQDIIFLWQRMEFLQLEDAKLITQYEFKIFPEKAPIVKPKKFKVKKDLLAGFGSAAETYTEIIDENETPLIKERKFHHDEEMLAYKRSSSASSPNPPKPGNCILYLIKNHLKMTKSGKIIKFNKLPDLCDIRVLCAFFNAILPNTFSGEILPNDRWSINHILKTLEKILRIDSDFEAADLNSDEDASLMAYFTALLLIIYQFRQSMKVIEYKEDLEYKIRYQTLSVDICESKNEILSSSQLEKNRTIINETILELDSLKERFDIKFCEAWKIHSKNVIAESKEVLKRKTEYQYEIMQVPRILSIADLCNRYFIYTKSLGSSGYYQLRNGETVNDDRKIILRDLSNEKIIIDIEGKAKSKVRSTLKVHQVGPVYLEPEKITKYEIYLDSYSKNKSLSVDEKFLYQLFPKNNVTWCKLLLKASSSNDVTTIKLLTDLFSSDKTFINWHDSEMGNTALHLAAIDGHFDAVLCLLECGADVNARNRFKQTPLFSAAEMDLENICGILLEWGAEISWANVRNQTVLDICKSNSLKAYIERKFKFYSELSGFVVSGNDDVLEEVIHDHRTKLEPIFINLRSRCIQGSTLLHTAAHFSKTLAVKELLMLRIDVNQRDYKGVSPLHRSSDLEIINLLIEAGADVNVKDEDNNQPLHSACYGEEGEKSQMEKIKVLLMEGANLIFRNNQFLMPIHCAAMQGRFDVIELLLDYDKSKQIQEALEIEKLNLIPPSMNFLAVSGGFASCAQWLLDRGFNFKENEANQLLRNVITGELVLHGQALNDTLNLLLYKTGADINKRYPPMSQTALHLAAHLTDSTDLMFILIQAGADVNATDNEHCTPLFISCSRNDLQSAKVMITNNVNINVKNNLGHTAFDYIPDYLEWINSDLFDEETVARLKAYNLKSTRNTLRLIDKKIRSKHDDGYQLRQLESRLDQNLFEDKIERAKSRCTLRPRSKFR